MSTPLLLLALFLPCPPAADEAPPGAAWATAPAGLVLHAGPGVNHAGVLMLDATTTVRTGETAGEYVEVFVPDGFPAYVHGDYATVDDASQTVTIAADRVNLRLLPSTLGLPPVGHLSAGESALLLGRERGWVRLLSPSRVGLWARAGDLSAAGSDAAARWQQTWQQREAARSRAVAAYRATDPGWQATQRRAEQADRLAAVDLAALSDGQLGAHAAEVDELLAGSTGALAERVAALAVAAGLEQERRDAARARSAELQREQAREAASLVREARALDMGLRFEGRGQALVIEGLVTRRASAEQDAVVYSIRDAGGRTFKLSAARGVADLPPLLGKTVVLEGRSIELVAVQGPVLVVDKVTRIVN